MFIHPPLFVYLSALLRRVGIPLPLTSVLLHHATAFLVGGIAHEVVQLLPGICKQRDRVALVATLVFVCCPVSSFASQKVWIDNCLLFTVSLSAYVHIRALGRGASYDNHSGVYRRWLWAQATSGLVFGLFALNSKITAWALLPFLCLWSWYVGCFKLCIRGGPPSSDLRFLVERACLWGCGVLAFSLPMCLAHGPWIYVYWVRTYNLCAYSCVLSQTYSPFYTQRATGRLLPNAWPSTDMLLRSEFVRAAVSKPWHSYLSVLLRFSPLALTGILFGLLIIYRSMIVSFQYLSVMVVSDMSMEPPSSSLHEMRQDGRPDSGCIIKRKSDLLLQLEHLVCIAAIATWPISFLAALSILGALGSGFQSRFILPIFPAASVLAAIAITRSHLHFTLGCLLLTIANMHLLYYGVLFAPLYADLGPCVWEVIDSILNHPFAAPSSKESFAETLTFMKHFGLDLQPS